MRSITVIGANGRTGRKVVNVLLKKGDSVNTVTRSGSYFEDKEQVNKKNLKSYPGDVSDYNSLDNEVLSKVVKGSAAVIFTASASKEGGKPSQVDKQGLINTARICIKNRVPRLVIVSSAAVSKPFSPVYLFLNLFGGIMKAKFEGENEVRKLYSGDDAKGLAYTIVRPGGLLEEPPKGVQALELNQGDNFSGRISRWDVAAVCVESIDSKDAAMVTLECHDADTRQPLANVGLSNLLRLTKVPSKAESTGKEKRGSTWKEIFTGLQPDF